MSADNWVICPKCKKENDELNKKRILDAAKKYGKIPADEYIALAKEVSKPIELEPTMREDYDIGINENGQFAIYYRCSCSECNFKYGFDYAEEKNF